MGQKREKVLRKKRDGPTEGAGATANVSIFFDSTLAGKRGERHSLEKEIKGDEVMRLLRLGAQSLYFPF